VQSVEPDSQEEPLASRAWGFIRFHVAFFVPVRIPELDVETDAGKKFKQELTQAKAKIGQLSDEVLAGVEAAWRAELDDVNRTFDTTRARASQLLTVTGLVTAVGGLVAHLPGSEPFYALAIADIALLLYCIVATLFLTIQAIKVGEWNVVSTPIPDPKDDAMEIRRRAVFRSFKALRTNRCRLERPVGYLKDAFVFFGVAVVALIVLVGFQLAVAPLPKVSGGAHGVSLTPTSAPTPTPTATASPLPSKGP
jgi:hypothetical protein